MYYVKLFLLLRRLYKRRYVLSGLVMAEGLVRAYLRRRKGINNAR
jgi:hypothetical protein